MKKATLIQECVRRMLNCCATLPEEERIKVLNEYAAKLRRSGYEEGFRRMVIKIGCSIYRKKMKEDEREGGKRVYRTKAEMVADKKEEKNGSWCEKASQSKVAAPLILDPTEEGVMVERIKKIIKDYNEKEKVEIKVVERGGRKTTTNVKSNHIGVRSCWSMDCPVCQGGDGGKNCRARGTVYEQRCNICKRDGKEVVYYGETGRNAYLRGKEHANDLRLGDRKNGLVRHMQEQHEGEERDYKMAVLTKHRGCLGRQIEEAVRIRESKDEILLNSKSEFMQPHIIRIEIEEGNVEERRGWW